MNIRKSHLMIQGGAYPLAFPTGAMTPKNLPRRKERAMSNDTIELNFKAGTFEEAAVCQLFRRTACLVRGEAEI